MTVTSFFFRRECVAGGLTDSTQGSFPAFAKIREANVFIVRPRASRSFHLPLVQSLQSLACRPNDNSSSMPPPGPVAVAAVLVASFRRESAVAGFAG